MEFYFKIIKEVWKSKSLEKKEKVITTIEWFVNSIIKILFLPLCVIGAVCSLLEEIFNFLSGFFWDLTNWLDKKEISFVSAETKQLIAKKLKKELNNKKE